MMYRDLTRQEKTTLNRFFDKWGLYEHFKDKSLLIKEDGTTEVYLTNSMVKDFSLKHNPVSAGLKLGELKKQVSLSIEGAAIFAGLSNRKQIVVNEQTEALVLYGRDIFGNAILSHTDDFDENEVVLIINKHGEAIGIGRTRFHASKIDKAHVAVTTIADRGSYLRDENEIDSKLTRR